MKIYPIVIAICLILTSAYSLSCSAVPTSNSILENGYDARQIFSYTKQTGVVTGDFDSANAGNEVAVAIQDHNVAELYHDGTGWKNRMVYTGANVFELFGGLSIGDVDPSHPGNELVIITSNVRKNATLIWGSGTSWHAREVFNDTAPLQSSAIGELDATGVGNEIVVCGYSKNVTLLKNNGATWDSEKIYSDVHTITRVIVDDVDPTYPGNEVFALVEISHKCVMIYNDGGIWKNYTLGTTAMGCIASGDFDSTNPGKEIVVGYGMDVYEFYGSGTSWNSRKLWTDTNVINGITVGEFDSTNPGEEIATVGGSDKVTMITGSGTTWTPTTLFTNPDTGGWWFLGITCGDVDPTHMGNEIIICGSIGKTFEIGYGKFVPELPSVIIPLIATVAIIVFISYIHRKRDY